MRVIGVVDTIRIKGVLALFPFSIRWDETFKKPF